MILRALIVFAFYAVSPAQAQRSPSGLGDVAFDRFLAELWKDAEAKGIARATFNKAFAGVTPDPRVMTATKRQPEFNKPAGAYVNSIASPSRGVRLVWSTLSPSTMRISGRSTTIFSPFTTS